MRVNRNRWTEDKGIGGQRTEESVDRAKHHPYLVDQRLGLRVRVHRSAWLGSSKAPFLLDGEQERANRLSERGARAGTREVYRDLIAMDLATPEQLS